MCVSHRRRTVNQSLLLSFLFTLAGEQRGGGQGRRAPPPPPRLCLPSVPAGALGQPPSKSPSVSCDRPVRSHASVRANYTITALLPLPLPRFPPGRLRPAPANCFYGGVSADAAALGRDSEGKRAEGRPRLPLQTQRERNHRQQADAAQPPPSRSAPPNASI